MSDFRWERRVRLLEERAARAVAILEGRSPAVSQERLVLKQVLMGSRAEGRSLRDVLHEARLSEWIGSKPAVVRAELIDLAGLALRGVELIDQGEQP